MILMMMKREKKLWGGSAKSAVVCLGALFARHCKEKLEVYPS
jgi:hypothetical protein